MAFFNEQGNIKINVDDAIKSVSSLESTFTSATKGMTLSAQAFSDKWTDAMYGIKDTKRIVSGILISQAFYTISNAAIEASGAVLQFSKDMESAAISMEYFVKGSEKAAEAAAFLREANTFAAKTPFSTSDVLSMSKYMQAMGIAMNKTKSVLTVITDTASATGATEQNLQRIVFGLGQIKTKGRLANEEIRQLANANIPIYDILSEELSLTGEQISNIGNYWIDSDKAVVAILSGLEKRYKGAADRISDTMAGMTDTLKDNALIIAQIASAGMYNKLADGMLTVRDAMDKLREVGTTSGASGMLNEVLIGLDKSGQVGTDILALIGNIRALSMSATNLYVAAKPLINLLGKSLYVSTQVTIGGMRVLSKVFTSILAVTNRYGLSVEQLAQGIGSLLIAYKAASALATLGQGMSLLGSKVYTTSKVVWSMIPALSTATTFTKFLTIGITGTLGVLGLATAAWNLFNTTVGGTGAAIEGSLPSNYTSAYDTYLAEMDEYNALIEKYQDSYNEPFSSIEDSGTTAFERIGDEAKKAAKKMKDGFIASFDEVYQVKMDDAAEAADEVDKVDFGAGLSVPTFKFPTVSVELPKQPTLKISDVFNEPIETEVVNGSALWKGILPTIASLMFIKMGSWFAKDFKPKHEPKNSAGGGSKLGTNVSDADKNVALNKMRVEFKSSQDKIKALIEAIGKDTNALTREAKLKRLDSILDIERRSLASINKLEKNIGLVSRTSPEVLDKADMLLTLEQVKTILESNASLQAKLSKNLKFALSTEGEKTRQEIASNNKQLSKLWTDKQAIFTDKSLENLIPKNLQTAFIDLEKNTELITNAFNETVKEIEAHKFSTEQLIRVNTVLEEKLKETVDGYTKAGIEAPKALREVQNSIALTKEHNKLVKEQIELEERIKTRTILNNNKDTVTDDGGSVAGVVENKRAMDAATDRLRDIKSQLESIKLEIRYSAASSMTSLAERNKVTTANNAFKRGLGDISKNVNNLLEPLKILSQAPHDVVTKLADSTKAIVSTIPTNISISASLYDVYSATIKEVGDITRDAIASNSTLSKDAYNGVVANLIKNMTAKGQAAGVSDEAIIELTGIVEGLAKSSYSNAAMKHIAETYSTAAGIPNTSPHTQTLIVQNATNLEAIKKVLGTIAEGVDDLSTTAYTDFMDEANQTVEKYMSKLADEFKPIAKDVVDYKNALGEQIKANTAKLSVSGIDSPYTDLTSPANQAQVVAKFVDSLDVLFDEVDSAGQYIAHANKLISSYKTVYGELYNTIATAIDEELQYAIADAKQTYTKKDRPMPKPRVDKVAEETKLWKQQMQDMLTQQDPGGSMHPHDRFGKMYDDAPWQLQNQEVFRNAYMSGSDVAKIENTSGYDGAQIPAVIVGNLTAEQLDVSGIKLPPMNFMSLKAMARGTAYEGVVLSSVAAIHEALGKLVLQGGNFINNQHTMQAQFDAFLADLMSKGLTNVRPMDAKVLSDINAKKMIAEIQALNSDGFDRYNKLATLFPDIAKQIAEQAATMGVDSAWIAMYNGGGIAEPDPNDYIGFDLSDAKQSRQATAKLIEFFTKQAREGSFTATASGKRVLKNFNDPGQSALININIPSEVMKKIRTEAEKLLHLQAKLVGPAIAGQLKEFLVGYTKTGIPLNMLESARNLPKIQDNVIKQFMDSNYDIPTSVKELNSIVSNLLRDIKGDNAGLRKEALSKLDNIQVSLDTASANRGANDSPLTIKLENRAVTMTPTDMITASSGIDKIKEIFSPISNLSSSMKTLNDVTNKINANIGKSLVDNASLYAMVNEAKNVALRIESLTGGKADDMIRQLNMIIDNQKITNAVDNAFKLADLDETIKYTNEKLAATGIDYDAVVKQYQATYKGTPEFGNLNSTVSAALETLETIAQISNMSSKLAPVDEKNQAHIGNQIRYTSNDSYDAYKKAAQEAGITNIFEKAGQGIKDGLSKLFSNTKLDDWLTKNVTKSPYSSTYVNDALKKATRIDATDVTLGKNKVTFGSAYRGNYNASDKGVFVDYAAKEAQAKNFVNVNDKQFSWSKGYGTLAVTVALEAISKMADAKAYGDLKSSLKDTGVTDFWDFGKASKAMPDSYDQLGKYILEGFEFASTHGLSDFTEDYFKLNELERTFLGSDMFNGGYRYGGATRYNIGGAQIDTANTDQLMYGTRTGKATASEESTLAYLQEQLALGKSSTGLVQLIDYLIASGDKDSKVAKEFYKVYGAYMDTLIRPSLTNMYAQDGDMSLADITSAVDVIAANQQALAQLNKVLLDNGLPTVESGSDVTVENLSIITSLLENIQSDFEKSALTNMDLLMKYNPVEDNPLIAEVSKLVAGLDVSGLNTSLATEISDKLGISFKELEGDDAVVFNTDKAMENLLGWTQKLPEALKIENLTTDELAVLAKAGIQINADGTGTFMIPQNANTTGTNRNLEGLDEEDFSDRLIKRLGLAGIGLGGTNLGQYGSGNIDLYNRPKVSNSDGSFSTVRSMSFGEDNKEILVPTVSDNGRILSENEAIQQYHDTGKYLGIFDTVEEANKYADTLHKQQDAYYSKTAGTLGIELDTKTLAQSMVGALIQLPSLKDGDSISASMSANEVDKLSGTVKMYDSGYMEIVDPKVLSGVKTLKQALDELRAPGGALAGGLNDDVYNALVDVDNIFNTKGKATAETIAEFSDGIRILSPFPAEWISPEQLAALSAAGMTVAKEGEETYITINRLANDMANGIARIPASMWNMSAETLKALDNLGIGIEADGEYVKVSMQGVLDRGITDVINLYLDNSELWDKLPLKVKDVMAQSGVATSEGFLVVRAQTEEGMLALGDIFAQKWNNINGAAKDSLSKLGVTMENELLTLQQVAEGSDVGAGAIRAKFEELPPSIQQALTGGDNSVAATLAGSYWDLMDATKQGFSGVATAVSATMGVAEGEVDQATKTMAAALEQAMINVELYKQALARVNSTPEPVKKGFLGIGAEYEGKSYSVKAGGSYAAVKDGTGLGAQIIRYRFTDSTGKVHDLDAKTIKEAQALAQRAKLPGAAHGGLINSDGIYRAGEFGKEEVVIPLEQASVLDKVGKALASHLPTGTYNITMSKSNLEVLLLEDILDVLKIIENKSFVASGLDYTPVLPSTNIKDYTGKYNYEELNDLGSNLKSVNKVMNSYLSTLFGVNNTSYDYVDLLEAISEATNLSSVKFDDMNLSSSNYLLALADMAKTTGMSTSQLLGMIDKSGNYNVMLQQLAESTGYTVDELLRMSGETKSTSDLLIGLEAATGISTSSLNSMINTTGSYDAMLKLLSDMTGISTQKLNELAGATGGTSTLISTLASATGLSTDAFTKLASGTGVSITTLQTLSNVTGYTTAEILKMMTATTGSTNVLDVLSNAMGMSTSDFYSLLSSTGMTTAELDKLRSGTGLSAGTLEQLATMTGMTTAEIAAMARDYNVVLGQLSAATGQAVTNVLGMSASDYETYMNNKRLSELIYANTGIWDTRLGSANASLRKQYGIETDNFTYMDLILASYKTMAEKTVAMATMSTDQMAYLQHLIATGSAGQKAWAEAQIADKSSASYQTGSSGSGSSSGSATVGSQGAYATIPGYTGNVGVEISSGKVTTGGLPVGTIVNTADGGQYKITGGTAGAYTSTVIKAPTTTSTSTRDRDEDDARETVAKAVYAVQRVIKGLFGFADGGVNDFTGMAQLHGSKTSSETIFNATDSKKLYELVHNTPDLTEAILKSISSRMPSADRMSPLIKIYNVPNNGIDTTTAQTPRTETAVPNVEDFTRRVLETILPAVFNMTTGNESDNARTPIYVGNLIADERGLTELERRLYDVRQKETTRR